MAPAMPPRVVDFRSDTLTHPTPEMRDAMREAAVGDDVYGEDPSVNELQALAAERVGMEAALFVPTGTMGNEVAIGVHCPRGSELLTERESHIFLYEDAGPAALWGVQARPLAGERGILSPRQVAEAVRDAGDVHEPRTSLLTLENTHNLAGGTVWTPAQTYAAVKAAREHGLKVHVDGARIFNSAVAQDVTAASLLRGVDSVMFCLSKGLSAPVGSMVCGSESFVAEAVRARKLLGGGMRQAGVLAAAGIVALNTMVDRLRDDHANLRRLASGLGKLPGLSYERAAVQTNILFVDVTETGVDARTLADRWAARGVKASALDARRIRFVTHRHISREDADWAIEQVAQTLARGRVVSRRPASSRTA
jgi:threonine aldolase